MKRFRVALKWRRRLWRPGEWNVLLRRLRAGIPPRASRGAADRHPPRLLSPSSFRLVQRPRSLSTLRLPAAPAIRPPARWTPRRLPQFWSRPRPVPLPRSLPGGPRVLLLLVLGVLGVAGLIGAAALLHPGRAPRALPKGPEEEAAAAGAGATPSAAPGVFSRMRPRSGDRMAWPRIGFRWSFQPDGDTLAAGAGVTYRVHVAGPGGEPTRVVESDAPEATLDLDDRFPFGECSWWIEASRPGHTTLRSPTETFELQP